MFQIKKIDSLEVNNLRRLYAGKNLLSKLEGFENFPNLYFLSLGGIQLKK